MPWPLSRRRRQYGTIMTTIILLIISNIFMTFAWYGNLRFPQMSMVAAILTGWAIALLEYCFAVPANRIGYGHGFTGGQLKIIQGSHHADGVRRLCLGRPQGADRPEVRRRFRLPDRRGLLHVRRQGLGRTPSGWGVIKSLQALRLGATVANSRAHQALTSAGDGVPQLPRWLMTPAAR